MEGATESLQRIDYGIPAGSRTIEGHEPATAGPAYLSAGSACGQGFVVDIVDQGIGNTAGHLFFMLEPEVEDSPDLVDIAFQ